MFVLLFVGCASEDSNTDMGENSWALEICEAQEENSSDYQLSELSLEGAELLVGVGFSGGCGEHIWRLCWDESYTEDEIEGEQIKSIVLNLQHQTDDTCEMFKTDELSFSLDVLGSQNYIITLGEYSVVYP